MDRVPHGMSRHPIQPIRGCSTPAAVSVSMFYLQVFEQLLRRRVTFNAYTYHCLLQLCGSAGSLDDALAVYNLQVGRAPGGTAVPWYIPAADVAYCEGILALSCTTVVVCFQSPMPG